ncbi:hypothetical protein [Crystallibacter degradans]|uniref:hypothetical protein n=1 Tax=Crystallibacter degradans TaxID=2726743 RepID=UPI001473F0C4|nr:hypothetical protein [Arthrobacter sp. SF27]NMR29118.1 hypothetical protein [Arthrobacter sp. SF27]
MTTNAIPTDAKVSADGLAVFDRTTSRWGRLTMLMGLALSLAGPIYIVFFAGLDVGISQVLVAFLAVAATFGVLWVIEPVTYYPILGQSSMYQAFMIGNIANKLIPAALTAQTAIDAKPGTRRAELSAVSAISGAVIIHIASLLIFVGLLGTWLLSNLPPDIMQVMKTFIVPAVLGAVHVQALMHLKQPRTALIAVLVSATVVFVISPMVPGFGMYGTVLAVLSTVALAWFLRKRTTPTDAQAS